MCAYHFSIDRGAEEERFDPHEFDTLDEAKCAGFGIVADLLKFHPRQFLDDDFRLVIADDRGLILYTMMVVGIDAPSTARSTLNPGGD